jgi:hypothetical protein
MRLFHRRTSHRRLSNGECLCGSLGKCSRCGCVTDTQARLVKDISQRFSQPLLVHRTPSLQRWTWEKAINSSYLASQKPYSYTAILQGCKGNTPSRFWFDFSCPTLNIELIDVRLLLYINVLDQFISSFTDLQRVLAFILDPSQVALLAEQSFQQPSQCP